MDIYADMCLKDNNSFVEVYNEQQKYVQNFKNESEKHKQLKIFSLMLMKQKFGDGLIINNESKCVDLRVDLEVYIPHKDLRIAIEVGKLNNIHKIEELLFKAGFDIVLWSPFYDEFVIGGGGADWFERPSIRKHFANSTMQLWFYDKTRNEPIPIPYNILKSPSILTFLDSYQYKEQSIPLSWMMFDRIGSVEYKKVYGDLL